MARIGPKYSSYQSASEAISIFETIFFVWSHPLTVTFFFDNSLTTFGTNSDAIPFETIRVSAALHTPKRFVLEFIEILENNLGRKAIKDFQPIQPGDVENTFADTSKLRDWINYSPKISIEKGINNFAKWYKNYYGYS